MNCFSFKNNRRTVAADTVPTTASFPRRTTILEETRRDVESKRETKKTSEEKAKNREDQRRSEGNNDE